MGLEWCKSFKHKVSNKFWSEVFKCCAYAGKELAIKSNSDIMQSCLWYNKLIFENKCSSLSGSRKVSTLLVILQIHPAKY